MSDSLQTHLGKLESEDLLRQAGALRELQEHPGWKVLVELVEVQAEKAKGQMVGRPLDTVQQYAYASGHIAGLESFPKIIDKVHEVARRVSDALDNASAGS